MLSVVKQYQFNFVSDGASTSLEVDASLIPLAENFRGCLPNGVLSPIVTSVATGQLANVTAALVGQKITFTFQVAPPQNDNNGNLILYTASFYLQYSE